MATGLSIIGIVVLWLPAYRSTMASEGPRPPYFGVEAPYVENCFVGYSIPKAIKPRTIVERYGDEERAVTLGAIAHTLNMEGKHVC